MSHTGNEPLLSALAGLTGGASQAISRGIAGAQQAPLRTARVERQNIRDILGLVQGQQTAKAKADAARLRGLGRDISGERLFTGLGRDLEDRESVSNRSIQRIEKELGEPTTTATARTRLEAELTVARNERGAVRALLPRVQILRDQLVGLRGETKRQILPTAELIIRQGDWDEDDLRNFIRQRTAIVDAPGRAGLEALVDFWRTTGRIRVSPAIRPGIQFRQPIGPEAPSAPEVAPVDELQTRVSQSLSPDFSTSAQTAKRGETRGAVQRFGINRRKIIDKETERLTETFFVFTPAPGGTARGRKQAVAIQRTNLSAQIKSFLEAEFDRINQAGRPTLPGAQAGLIPPAEDMQVAVQRGEAILPQEVVQQIGGPDAIRQLAPGALEPPRVFGETALPPGRPPGIETPGVPGLPPSPLTPAIPLAPPPPAGMDLTAFARPEIRRVAQNLAGPGASAEDLDTLGDLMEGLLEDEDLRTLGG